MHASTSTEHPTFLGGDSAPRTERFMNGPAETDGEYLRRMDAEASEHEDAANLCKWQGAQRAAQMRGRGMSQRKIASEWGRSVAHVNYVLAVWDGVHLGEQADLPALDLPHWNTAYQAAKTPNATMSGEAAEIQSAALRPDLAQHEASIERTVASLRALGQESPDVLAEVVRRAKQEAFEARRYGMLDIYDMLADALLGSDGVSA